ncbi:MAG: VOC family protein [Ignavibacteria bacterium]|nr:VOC family protein [Ignavibacteria bacterium]
MKTEINAYLAFNGTAREAMTFYRDVLGGELSIMAVADTPAKDKFPEAELKKVMHSALISGDITLFATDMLPDGEFTEGNGVTMSLSCSSEKEIDEYFNKLSNGGKVIHPLHREFWGGMFAVVVDKFGKKWMLNSEMDNK